MNHRSGSLHGIKLAISGLLSTSSALKTTFSWCVSCLKRYSEVSGQVINLLKHPVMLDAKVPKNAKEGIKHVIGIKAKGGESLYLGPPLCFSGSKRKLLSFMWKSFREKSKEGFLSLYLREVNKFLSNQWILRF